MKKKLISVLLSAAMATTMLAGCGSTAADTGAAPAETKATEEKTEAADTEAETDTASAFGHERKLCIKRCDAVHLG